MNESIARAAHLSREQSAAGLDRLAIALVILAGIVSALHVGKGPIAMPGLSQDFGRSTAELGWVVSVFAVVGVLGGMAAGVLAQRLGDTRVLVSGLVILGTASLLGSMVPSYEWLIASRVVEGLGFLLIVVAAPAVLNRLTPASRRSLVFGFWSTFMGIGIALSMLLGPLLAGWRWLWMADGALAGAIALWVAARVPQGSLNTKEGNAARGASWQDVHRVLTARQPVLLALSFAAYNLQFFAVMAFLPTFLMQRAGLNQAQSGVAAACIVTANIVGNLFAGYALQRGMRASRLIAWTCGATGLLGLAAFMPFTPAPLVIALCGLLSAGAGILPTVFVSRAPGSAPAPRLAPLSLGLVMQGNYLGQVLGPAGAGLLLATIGWPAIGAQVAAAALAGILLAAWLGRARDANHTSRT